MLDKTDFLRIRKDLAKEEKTRSITIQKSTNAIADSKKVIYALQRGDIKKAGSYLNRLKNKLKTLKRSKLPIANVAFQEYVEAACFYAFFTKKKIPTRTELGVSTEAYLLGLCDLTGELTRKVLNDLIIGNEKRAMKAKKLIEEIYGEFLHFNLRNSELRKKSDSIRWNLQKVEDVVYQYKVRK